MYEHKCRDKEEADQNVNRNTNTGNAKQMEKVESDPKGQRRELWASPLVCLPLQLHTKALQAKQNAEEAGTAFTGIPTAVSAMRAQTAAKSVRALLMSPTFCTLRFSGRHVLPAECENAGQGSRRLDRGTREGVRGKDG